MMLERSAPHSLGLLRIVAGLLFFLHGPQKLLGWPTSHGGDLDARKPG